MFARNWFVTLVMCVQLIPAKKVSGVLNSRDDFAYLDRFCFQSDTGALEYTIKYPKSYPSQMLLLYFDTEDQWPRAYKQLTKCEDRIELLSNHSDNNQIIYLDPLNNNSGGDNRCQVAEESILDEWIICTGTRVFRSARSRWWFLAVANCDPHYSDQPKFYIENQTYGVYSEYSLLMTNGLPNEVLKYHFSIDEWLILPSDALFFILQGLTLLVAYIMGLSLHKRRLYHSTYRMCTQSIAMNTLGLGFLMTNYIIYSVDGTGLPVIKTTGQLIRALADMLFVYMCLAISRGLNVSKMKLTLIDRIFLALMTFVFIFSYLLMQYWEIRFFDPAMVYAQSESVPGYLLAIWRVVAWVFFAIAILISAYEADKRRFFVYFGINMTPWFWTPPIFVLIANFCLNSWVRAEVVNIVDNIVTFYGYAVFLYLARPMEENQNFPFHIRTTQVATGSDQGFDPRTAYVATAAANTSDVASVNGVNPISPRVSSSDDKGYVTRPQFSS